LTRWRVTRRGREDRRVGAVSRRPSRGRALLPPKKKKKKKKKREQNDTLTHPRFLEAALVQSKPGVFADSFWPALIGFDSVRVAKRVAGPTSR
jgi:hypothetical protein